MPGLGPHYQLLSAGTIGLGLVPLSQSVVSQWAFYLRAFAPSFTPFSGMVSEVLACCMLSAPLTLVFGCTYVLLSPGLASSCVQTQTFLEHKLISD